MVKRLEEEGIHIKWIKSEPGSEKDAQFVRDQAEKTGSSAVVIDGYQFKSDYQRVLYGGKFKTLVIDDYGYSPEFYADFILNQNLSADESLYHNRSSQCRLLLGLKYVLLRREFRRYNRKHKEIPPIARKLLITMGGGDSDNVTLKVMQAVAELNIDGLEVVVVVGDSPLYGELVSRSARSKSDIRIERAVKNIPKLLSWADMAITAASSTVWETAFMGLPSISIILAENQRSNSEWLGQMGMVINLGWYFRLSFDMITDTIKTLAANREQRYTMSNHSMKLIDGEGVGRVVMHMQNEDFYLRWAREDDCELLFQWVNEPTTRTASFNSDPIGWDEHCRWFRGKIQDHSCAIFIAANEAEQPLGMARFEIEEKEAVISISLDSRVRGQGLGAKLIEKATEKIINLKDLNRISAYIKTENSPSVRAFKKAGYKNPVKTKVMNYPAYLMIYP